MSCSLDHCQHFTEQRETETKIDCLACFSCKILMPTLFDLTVIASEMPFLHVYTGSERLYVLLVFGGAALAAALSLYAWHHREQSSAAPFAVFMGLVTLWCVTSGMFAAGSTASTVVFWNNAGISVAIFTSFTFLVFSLHYTGRERWLTRRRYSMLLGVSTLLILALWTDQYHHQVFRALNFSRQGAFMMWNVTIGPVFFIHMLYNYGQVFVGIGLIVQFFLKSYQLYRQQALTMLMGFLTPLAASVIDAGALIPGMPELAPVGFVFMGLAFAWAMFRHKLLDVVPVARHVLIDSMEDGMLVLDTHERIVDMNRAMECVLGQASFDVVGHMIDTIGTFWIPLITSIQHTSKLQTEVQLQRDERLFWYDLRIMPLFNRRDQFSGHLIVLRDITERKRTEQQLFKLQKAVETTEVGITITNVQGVIEYSNPADAAMHGYRVEELLGQPSSLFASQSRYPLHTPPLEEFQGGAHWVRESINARKDESEFAVRLISNSIYDDEGLSIGRVTICEDITERKRAEAELLAAHRELKKKNRQLQDLNASKDKFFSIISHDLRSPFSALLGFAQLLDANALTYTPAEIQHRATRIRISAERLYALLENLLTWSRLQRGVMEYHPEQLDLWGLVVQNFDLFQSKSEEKGVTLNNIIEPGTIVYADEQMLDTVLRNLLSNALKFTASAGTITLSVEQQKQLLQVFVADTGVGMDADTQAKLFREDVQCTNPGTAGEKGTGLGLLLCQELVRKNGGTIQVNSEAGQGTVFTFTVPAMSVEQ